MIWPKSAKVRIVHMLPDLLNLYGDGGNVSILEKRLSWRGIPVEVQRIDYGEEPDLASCDLMFLGGGPDREQRLASEVLHAMSAELRDYVMDGAPMLAICGGFQILGRTWLLAGQEVEGLGILDLETRRPGSSADRLVDNIALDSKISTMPVVGYENHAGRTFLGSDVEPFGKVISKTGWGNNDKDAESRYDGVLFESTIGTYLHGPLLSKNPEVADWLLERAAKRSLARNGTADEGFELPPLDDSEEIAANLFMAERI